MKYVKTFEELWPFRNESDADKNKKALVSICKYLLDHLSGKKLCDYKIKRIEVGYSKVKENVFIIQFSTDTSDIIRFTWEIDSNFKIVDFKSYYITREGKMLVHSLKQKMDRANIEIYVELNKMVDLMNKFFKEKKLL
jgi:hypothetical protein